jgi:hypothetical protein
VHFAHSARLSADVRAAMIQVGYMAKRIVKRPDWLKANQVVDVYSVSNCISKDFADYINYWKHNGFWLFDSPEIIYALARENSVDIRDARLFFYEVYNLEYDDDRKNWERFGREESFTTNVVVPSKKSLMGYDVVTFSTGNVAECSPLSCNSIAGEVSTNEHCLLKSLEEAKRLLEDGKFENSEPGPYRIFAVHSVSWS